jgi:hypothetical protein
MKNLWMFTLLISTISYSQKTYFFDFKMEYEYMNYSDSTKNCIKTFYVNSKNNTYFAKRTSIDTANSKIEFIDRNGVYLLKKFSNKIFNDRVIYINQSDVKNYSYPFIYQLDNYHFSDINDTIVNGKICKRLSFLSNNLNRAKKKKIGTLMYILDTNLNHQPLLEFSTAFEVWKLNRKMPNGIIIESIQKSYENILVSREKLIQIIPISMNLTIKE